MGGERACVQNHVSFQLRLFPVQEAVDTQRILEAPLEVLPIPHMPNPTVIPDTLNEVGHRFRLRRLLEKYPSAPPSLSRGKIPIQTRKECFRRVEVAA